MEAMSGMPRDHFLRLLQDQGVPATEGHIEPLYRRPLFVENSLPYRNDGCPVSDRVWSEYLTIMQPFFLGPEEWMVQLAELVRGIQQNARMYGDRVEQKEE
jgi:hypothetical protein